MRPGMGFRGSLTQRTAPSPAILTRHITGDFYEVLRTRTLVVVRACPAAKRCDRRRLKRHVVMGILLTPNILRVITLPDWSHVNIECPCEGHTPTLLCSVAKTTSVGV